MSAAVIPPTVLFPIKQILKGLYKSASFVVQAIAFKQSGKYITRQRDLLQTVSEKEQVIVDAFLRLKNGGGVDFENMSETLFGWSKNKLSFI